MSVERVLEYANLPSEAPDVIFKNRPNLGWPAQGAVKFDNYSTRYREGLDNVLKNISLNIKAHEKVGVVGRTGAGKSSLTLALFRIIEPTSGTIRQVPDSPQCYKISEANVLLLVASTVWMSPLLACSTCDAAWQSFHRTPHYSKALSETISTHVMFTMIRNCGVCLVRTSM